MVIFITGATGFIGSNLIKKLCSNHEIIKIYSLYRNIHTYEHPKITWVKGDLQHISELCPDMQVELFIHCAELMGHGNNAQKVLRENIANMKGVLDFCKTRGIKNFVYFSSVNVHLRNKGTYARSKVIAEALLLESGFDYKIIRPALVFGNGKNGLTSLANYVKKLPVVPVFGDGEKLEQPICIEELAVLSEMYIMDNEWNSVMDFLGSQAYKYNDIIKIIARHYERNVKIVHLPVKPALLICKLLDRLGILFPITAEQIAHIDEDLDGDMHEIYRKYPITVTDFETKLIETLND